MPNEFEFEAGFPNILESSCIAYDSVNNYSQVNISYTGSGELSFAIGTDSDVNGSNIVWQEISVNTNTTLSSSNKALFYRVVGTTGSYITDIKIKYS